MDQNELKYWLGLLKIPFLGAVRLKKLLDEYGTASAIWQGDDLSIAKVAGVSLEQVQKSWALRSLDKIEEEISHLQSISTQIITIQNPTYPQILKEIYDPPVLLFLQAQNLTFKDIGNSIAIVGTRHASQYGLDKAFSLAKDLAGLGFTIVSGLAAGIDAAAHKGALAVGGKTIAILGHGIDYSFPPENHKLRLEIKEKGIVATEFPLGVYPSKQTFPRRNRIISGLSQGVIMIEGSQKSGALITAKSALDQNREVFALPGNVDNPNSFGPHSLIKQGAKLIEKVEDILEEFNIEVPPLCHINCCGIPHSGKSREQEEVSSPVKNLSSEEQQVFDVLGNQPIHIDILIEKTNWNVSQAMGILLAMEMKDLIKTLPGKYYQKV